MNRLVKWLAGIAAVFCVLFVGITQIVMPGLLEKAGPYAEKMAAGYVNGTVQLGSVTWPGSNTLLVKDILVRDQKQQTVATVPEIRVSVNPFKAFSGLEKAVSAIDLERPTVFIKQDKEEHWNYENLLKPSQSETTPFYGKLNIHQGTAVVQLPEGTWQYQIDGSVDGSYNPAFDLDFRVNAPGMETATVLGSIDNKGVGKIVMKSDRVDLAPYHALALRYGGVKEAAGLVTGIDGEWNNDGKDTVLRGKCTLQDVRGRYQMNGQELPFRITGNVSSSDHVITADKLQVSLNEQDAVLSGALDIHDPDNPEGHLSLRSDKFTYNGETLKNIEAEAVLAGNKAAVNYFTAAYRDGRISGQGVYEPASGKLTGAADIRKVTLDGETFNGEKFVLNAGLVPGKPGSAEYQANIAAMILNAGADMLLLPADLKNPEVATFYDDYIAGISDRIAAGIISEERLNESVIRVLRLKVKYGIFDIRDPFSGKPPFPEGRPGDRSGEAGSREHQEAACGIAGEAVTLLKNNSRTLPFSAGVGRVALLAPDRETLTTLSHAAERLREEGYLNPDTVITADYYLDPDLTGDELHYPPELRERLSRADAVIGCSALKDGRIPGRSSASWQALSRAIADTHAGGGRFALLSGNLPYDAALYPEADAIVLSYLGSGMGIFPDAAEADGRERTDGNCNAIAAMERIFGKGVFRGTLPVNIPEIRELPDGSRIYGTEVLYRRGFREKGESSPQVSE